MKNISICKSRVKRAVEEALSLKTEVFVYKTTDSTNTRAKLYAEKEKGANIALFIAEHQSAGRGRFGRSFDSPTLGGLYFSLLIPSDKLPCDLSLATPRAAVAVSDAILKLTGFTPEIKWVNDILAGGKKLCGILAEGVFSPDGTLSHLIVGIGINTARRCFPDSIRDIAVSLEEVTGCSVDRNLLCTESVLNFLSDEYSDSYVMDVYRKRSAVIGKEITVRRIGGETFSARATGITDGGALRVETAQGKTEDLISAEVSIKIN